MSDDETVVNVRLDGTIFYLPHHKLDDDIVNNQNVNSLLLLGLEKLLVDGRLSLFAGVDRGLKLALTTRPLETVVVVVLNGESLEEAEIELAEMILFA